MAAQSSGVAVGTVAPDFSLPSTDGGTVSLHDFDGEPALLVAFLCNHCPYVRHIEDELGRLTAEMAALGLATVAISANDVASYPDDDLAHLAEQRRRAGFDFPYLLDESQQVALAYGAVCTPDLFLYDADRKLAYRGQFDDTRPRGGKPATGDSLRAAIEHVVKGEAVPAPHLASVGCSIKWRPENEPR